jgi:hypothetical protein
LTTNEKIAALRAAAQAAGAHGVLLMTSDPHSSEYLPAYYNSLPFFSGFTGENSTLVVTLTGSALWCDGRFYVQGDRQLAGTEIECMHAGSAGVPTVEEYLTAHFAAGQTLLLDGSCVPATIANGYAAALAKSDDCEGVDMICLPEVPFNVEHFIEKVRVMQEKKPSIVIAVSEGVKLEDGRYVCELADDVHAVDAFGHKALTGTARYLANVVARNLDTKTRCIELSTLQRCAGHLTSRTDITEAYQVGGAAAKAAFEGVTGQMVALKRISNSPYQCTTELHPISEVANLEKKVPLSWMNENHTQMTEEFLEYARPLIQAELTPLYIAGLPHHIYLKKQK